MIFCSIVLVSTQIGCGELGDSQYQGEALYVVRGNILSVEDTTIKGPIHLSVVWLNLAQGIGSVHQQQMEVTDTSFPAGFEMPLFERPPPAMLVDVSPPECTSGVRTQIIDEVVNYQNGNEDEWPLFAELGLLWWLNAGQASDLDLQLLVEQGLLPILTEQGLVPQTNAELQSLVGCAVLASRLITDPNYLQAGYEGRFGFGYITAYVDGNRDGTLARPLEAVWSNLDLGDNPDEVLAISAYHMLLYTEDFNQAAYDSLAHEQGGIVTNPDAVTSRFQLMQHECGEPGETNRARIIENTQVELWSLRKALESEAELCRDLLPASFFTE